MAEQFELMHKNWQDIIDFGPRFINTTENNLVANYILRNTKSLNENSYEQKFSFESWSVKNDFFLEYLSPDKKEVETAVLLGSGSTNGIIEGKVKPVGRTIIWNMYSWPRYGIYGSKDKLLGYISVRPDGKAIPQTLAGGNSLLPHFAVGREELDYIAKHSLTGDLQVRGRIDSSVEKGIGRNIIVPFRTDRDDKKIVICAHYDTVYNSVGAYDNGAGAALLFELVRIVNEHKLNKNIDIVFTDGEEWNLAGSRYYARNTDLSQLEYVLNIDGIGRKGILEIWSGPEEFEREIMELINQFSDDMITSYKCPPPPGSDHTPFYDKGIPSCMFTFNDLEILHTSNDRYNKKIFKHMKFTVGLTKFILIKKGVIAL